jgi:hypothetical protein
MNEKKLSYELPIFHMLRQFKERFKNEGLDVDTRFIDYYGTFCPRCGSNFKVYSGSVKDAKSLSAFIVQDQGKAVVYCVCKSCSKQLASSSMVKGDPVGTEKRIWEKLPDLTRHERPSDEQIQKELDIFKRL